MHILSFLILDDLSTSNGYGPVHTVMNNLEYNTLETSLKKIASPFFKYIANIKRDPEYYWYKSPSSDEISDPTGYYFEQDYDVSEVIQNLISNQYYCWNRYQKYYVIAFAIDYVRFSVFSKDCDKMIIKWREDDQNDKIIPYDFDNNYNENPVISLMKELKCYDTPKRDTSGNNLEDDEVRITFMNKTDMETILSTNP